MSFLDSLVALRNTKTHEVKLFESVISAHLYMKINKDWSLK